MSFDVSPEAYGQFMGRFSEPLAVLFADHVSVRPGQRFLDVGCGPGALTAVMVERLGAGAVAAVDPSPSFVAAARARLPGVDVQAGSAEELPFGDDDFDLCAAQLVVHFMADPVAGLAEMTRVTKAGGVVGATVWDHSGDAGPLSLFWRAVQDLDPGRLGEAALPGAREGHLLELFEAAGLSDAQQTTLTVAAPMASFEAWWLPMTYGIGPAGAYVGRLDDGARRALEEHCRELLPGGPFEVRASAWCVTARA